MILSKIKQNRVVKNIFALGILQIANYIIPLLAWPLLARQLGLEQFGVLMMIFAVYGIAGILTDFGFNLSATYTISQNQNNKEQINQLLGNVFFIKFLLAFISCIGAIAYIYFKIPHQEINIISYIIIISTIIIQSFQCVWFFQGIEKMKHITTTTILSKVLYLLVLALLLPYFKDLNTALFCFLISQLVMIGLYINSLYKEQYCIIAPKISMLMQEFKFSFSFFISRVAVSVYTAINTLLIGHFAGASVAGLYSSAEKLYAAGTSVSGILSQALYPHMAKTHNLKLLVKIVSLALIPFILGCTIAYTFSEEIIVLIFGDAFRSASEYLRLFLALMCITFISITIGYPGFAAINKIKLANYTVMFGAIIHLIGLTFLFLNQLITAKNVLLMVILTESVILIARIALLFFFKNSSTKEARL